MLYAKIINNKIQFAPRHITIGTNNIWNASSDIMLSLGWKSVILTQMPAPPEGYYYELEWEEDENTIIQTWILKEIPEEVSLNEALSILLGGDYDIES